MKPKKWYLSTSPAISPLINTGHFTPMSNDIYNIPNAQRIIAVYSITDALQSSSGTSASISDG